MRSHWLSTTPGQETTQEKRSLYVIGCLARTHHSEHGGDAGERGLGDIGRSQQVHFTWRRNERIPSAHDRLSHVA